MNRRQNKAVERWFRFPRAVLLYIPLYVASAVPMFTSDPGNPARAFSFALMLWVTLTLISTVIALLVAGLGAGLRDRGLFEPLFNATFVMTWIVMFGVMYS